MSNKSVDEVKAARSRDYSKLEACGSENSRQINGEKDGRELLEALKDEEDHFIKAYNSGKAVSRMLEANKVPLLSGLDDIEESSKKLIRSITWNPSNSLHSSSSKSLLTSSSQSYSSWTELRVDSYEECGGMGSGSHSSTIERLYA